MHLTCALNTKIRVLLVILYSVDGNNSNDAFNYLVVAP